MSVQPGDRVRVTPDPALFSDPSDYRYVCREEGITTTVFTVDSILAPTPRHDSLPRSGIPLFKLVDDIGRAAYAAAEHELTVVNE